MYDDLQKKKRVSKDASIKHLLINISIKFTTFCNCFVLGIHLHIYFQLYVLFFVEYR